MLGGLIAFFALIILGQFNPDNAVASLPAALIFLIIGQIIFKGSELEAPEPESASAVRRDTRDFFFSLFRKKLARWGGKIKM